MCVSVQVSTNIINQLHTHTHSFGGGGYDFMLMKTDALGVEQWTKVTAVYVLFVIFSNILNCVLTHAIKCIYTHVYECIFVCMYVHICLFLSTYTAYI
jgi:hypothetical protein